MNNTATVNTHNAPPTTAITSIESPAVAGTSTAIPALAVNIFSQLIVRPTLTANDAVTLDLNVNRISAGEVGGPQPAQMSRDRALTFNTIGPRLVAARELNGIPQQEAARMAGMGNPTQWSMWELGRRAPPLYALLAASKTLGVSMDFLFGLSDDPERDARAARRTSCVRAVRQMLTQTAESIADRIESSDALAGPDASNFRELLDAAAALIAAVGRYHQLNVLQFEESRGGATVLAAAGRMEEVEIKCRGVLRGHDAFAERMRLLVSAIGPLE